MPFAKALATAILNFNGDDSFVVGIHGKWGTGKSSVLNLCVAELDGSGEHVGPDVLRFNPWNFSDQNQLVLQFLRQFTSHLRKYEKKGKLKTLIESLEDYSAALSPPFEALPYGKAISFSIRTGFSLANRTLGISKDLESLFSNIGRQLKELGRRTVVIIDDIDRLTATEIRQVFQLVKLSARFPNVIYLLSFDRDAVSEALGQLGIGSGDDYLEKIVQVSFDLPPVSDVTMNAMVIEGIAEITKQHPPAYFDEKRFISLYHGGLKRSFTSLRDVRRFINGLEFGFGMIAKEVNGVDFIGIEALRVFYPRVYEAVRTHRDIFVGHTKSDPTTTSAKQFKDDFENVLSLAGAANDDLLKDLLIELFPKLSYANGETRYGHQSEEWEKTRRVATSRFFDFYFQLVVPTGEISVGEIDQVLATSGDSADLLRILISFKQSGRIQNLMESLRHRLGEVPSNNLPNVLSSLIDLGDSVSQAGSPMFGDIPEYWYVRWCIFDVIDLIKADQRVEVLQRVFAVGNGVGTMINTLTLIGETQTERSDKYKEFTPESTNQLRETIVSRIHALAANADQLVHNDRLPVILWAWRNWGDPSETNAYVEEIIADPVRVLSFLKRFIFQTRSAQIGDRVVRKKDHLAIGELTREVDLGQLLKVLNGIDANSLSEEQRHTLKFSRQQIEEFAKSGSTPEEFLRRQQFSTDDLTTRET